MGYCEPLTELVNSTGGRLVMQRKYLLHLGVALLGSGDCQAGT